MERSRFNCQPTLIYRRVLPQTVVPTFPAFRSKYQQMTIHDITPVVDWSLRHMAKTVLAVFILLFGSLILFIFVHAILSGFGIRF